MIYTDGTPDFARPHKRLEVRHGQEVVIGEEISEQELEKLQAFAEGFACGMGLEVRHGLEDVIGEEVSEQELDKLQAFAAGFACGMGEPSETVSRPR